LALEHDVDLLWMESALLTVRSVYYARNRLMLLAGTDKIVVLEKKSLKPRFSPMAMVELKDLYYLPEFKNLGDYSLEVFQPTKNKNKEHSRNMAIGYEFPKINFPDLPFKLMPARIITRESE